MFFQKINDKISPECRTAYECFLRSQVFNGQNSLLLKKLPEAKKDEIFAFTNNDSQLRAKNRIQMTQALFEDVDRQEEFIQVHFSGFFLHRILTPVLAVGLWDDHKPKIYFFENFNTESTAQFFIITIYFIFASFIE